MTRGKFFFYLFLIGAVVFAVFVWPTRYRQIREATPDDPSVRAMRADRLTDRVEVQNESGEWVEFAPPPPAFDPKETAVGRGASKAQQAQTDIRKMNEVAKETVDNGTLGK